MCEGMLLTILIYGQAYNHFQNKLKGIKRLVYQVQP